MKAKDRQKQREEATRTNRQSPTKVVVAESAPQLGRAIDNTPILIPMTFDEHSSQPSSSTQQASPRLPTPSLSDPATGFEEISRDGTQAAVPLYQIPPPPSSLCGLHTPQYPSQAMHAIMGGPQATNFTRGKSDAITAQLRGAAKPHLPTTSRRGRERDRVSKRPLEEQSATERGSEEGLCDVSGLSTSQRVSAFLSTSEGSSDLSTKVVKDSPLRGTHKQPASGKELCALDTTTTKVVHQGLSKPIPAPNETYFPVAQLPPLQVSDPNKDCRSVFILFSFVLQTGNRSIDTSIQVVRSKMDKVGMQRKCMGHTYIYDVISCNYSCYVFKLFSYCTYVYRYGTKLFTHHQFHIQSDPRRERGSRPRQAHIMFTLIV